MIRWNRFAASPLLAAALCLAAVALSPASLFAQAAAPASPSSSEAAASAEKPYFFIVMADPQFGHESKNENFEAEEKNFREAIAHANRLKPAFVVICGDLVNEVGSQEQIDAFLRVAKEFSGEYPVHWASGNHDVSGAPTPESIAAYEEVFGPDRFTFDYAGDRFFVINSSIIFNPVKAEEENEEQLAWLKSELKKVDADGVENKFVVQHHPWFMETPDEPNTLYNTIRQGRRDPYLELLRAHDVLATFAGHTHFEAYGRDGDMEMITTSSICPPWNEGDKSGFRIVKVSNPEGIEHQFHPLDEMPEKVVLEHE